MLNESTISKCARYVTNRTRHVIESFGPRAPGSEGERRTQEFVREELAACCDGEVLFEPFQVAGKAFFLMQAVAALTLLASVVLWHAHPAISLGLDMLALSVLYFQFWRYRLFLDPFFPKSTSYNVYGLIKPKGETRRRIILSGHADAAREWRLAYLAPRLFPYFFVALLAGLAGIVLLHLAGFIAWLAGGAMWEAAQNVQWLQWLLVPGILLGVFFNNVSRTVPGANDNLSGTFAAMGIAKHLKESGVQLQNTELGIAILGSEEAGLRGAKVFAEKHKNEFCDVETAVIVLETLRDLDHIKVYNRDMNGTIRLDDTVCRLLRDAGKACGLDLPYATVFVGSSDAAAFAQAGWRAGALAAMDPRPADYYHTRRDNWDNMDEACLRKAIAVVCAAIRIYDTGKT